MAKKSVYSFRNGYRHSKKLDPKKVVPKLLDLSSRYKGKKLVQQVVAEASPKESPLHPAFTWDDQKAAAAYRERQARDLLKSVVIVEVESNTGAQRSAPVFVFVPKGDDKKREASYRPVVEVIGDEELFQEALGHLQRNMQATVNGVNQLKQIARKTGEPERVTIIATIVRLVTETNNAIKTLSKMA